MVEVFVKSAYVIEMFFVFHNIYLAAKLNPPRKIKNLVVREIKSPWKI